MHSDLYDERYKGKRYAEAPRRYYTLHADHTITFREEDEVHLLKQVNEAWECDCTYFEQTRICGWLPYCRHTLGLEQTLSMSLTANSPFIGLESAQLVPQFGLVEALT
jgi:hypothetical protein